MTKINNENFSLEYDFSPYGVKIDMSLLGDISNTVQIPDIYTMLISYLPTILTNECLNQKRLSFRDEVKETELGHLFEHILLEYMCINKNMSTMDVCIEGRTYWDTTNGQIKNFTINIYCSLADVPVFIKSLKPSCYLMNVLFAHRESPKAIPVFSSAPRPQ